MSQLIRYTAAPAAPMPTRHQRAIARACQDAAADAQIVRARIAGRALATTAALQATAALSHLEAALATDELIARRLGPIMHVAACGFVADIASLSFEG